MSIPVRTRTFFSVSLHKYINSNRWCLAECACTILSCSYVRNGRRDFYASGISGRSRTLSAVTSSHVDPKNLGRGAISVGCTSRIFAIFLNLEFADPAGFFLLRAELPFRFHLFPVSSNYFAVFSRLLALAAPSSSGRDVPSFLSAGEATPLALFMWFSTCTVSVQW